jgi:methionyl aminopeptidase
VIVYKSPEEIGKMRRAGRIVAGTIERVLAAVRPNVTTAELDSVAEEYILEQGATPSFKGYGGGAGAGRVPFPASICTSINDEIVHGIPSAERSVDEGDLLKLDFGAIWEGFHGDSAVTVVVGEPRSAEAEKLVRVTEEALEAGIAQIRPGGRLSDIGAAVEQVARGAGFEVVREYVGHGIGRNMHEDPQIPNYGKPGRGPLLKPGLVVAVEPMVNVGGWETSVLPDGWTVVTEDGSLSAHFEHTIAVTEHGNEVLTARA